MKKSKTTTDGDGARYENKGERGQRERETERVRKKTRSSEAIIQGNLSNSKGTTLYVPSSL